MLQRIQDEPVLAQAFVQAIVGFSVSFGWDLGETQVASILAVSAAVLGLMARRQVTPTANPKAPDGTSLMPGGRMAAV